MNINTLLLIITLGALALSGCTSVPVETTEKSSTQKPADSLTQAADFRKRGNWLDAIRVLEQAQQLHPDSRVIQQTLDNLKQAWQHEKQTRYHRLAIAETRALLQQQHLLKSISENSPADIRAKTGLLMKAVQLEGKLDELNDCINYQKQHNLELASTCGHLVHQIEQSEDSRKKYQSINQAYQQALQQSRLIRKQRSEQQLLKEAGTLIEQGAYLEAHVMLEEVLNSSPDNSEALALIQQLDSRLKQQAEILFSVGDQLYRDGQLEQAVAVWKSLLKLSPDDTNLKARIERAERVLTKLESLRKEQAEAERKPE